MQGVQGLDVFERVAFRRHDPRFVQSFSRHEETRTLNQPGADRIPHDEKGDRTTHDNLRGERYCGRLNSPPYTAFPRMCPCIAFSTFARVSNASAVG